MVLGISDRGDVEGSNPFTRILYSKQINKEDKSMRTTRMIFLALALVVSIYITGGLAYAATALKENGTQQNTPPAFAPDQVITYYKGRTPITITTTNFFVLNKYSTIIVTT